MSPRVSVAATWQLQLGEGLHWDASRLLLWLVDIVGQEVLWFDPVQGAGGRRSVPEPVGWVVPIENSPQVLIGLASGIARCDPFDSDGPVEWLDRGFPGDPDLRLNDAKTDQRGRIWYGSMSRTDETSPVGALACYQISEGSRRIIDTDYRVPNGPAFNQDGSVMLHSDSARLITYQYRLDPETGTVRSRSVWRSFSAAEGFPDGMAFDSEGYVWIAHWGAARVCRYAPDGDLQLAIEMPSAQVSNICFGGADLNRLFVTSASVGLDRSDDPHAGDLFEIHGLEVTGLPPWPVRV